MAAKDWRGSGYKILETNGKKITIFMEHPVPSQDIEGIILSKKLLVLDEEENQPLLISEK